MWVFAVRAAWWARAEGEVLASGSCLFSQAAVECALEISADAQAPLRDASWCQRRQLHRQQVSTWALELEVEDPFVLAALVDAIVFAEWLKDVNYFSTDPDSSERLSWLAESPLGIDLTRLVSL
jgi:hypothetical protein